MTTLSLASVLAESARRYPGKIAVIEGAARYTYFQMWESAREFTASLKERGVGPGDRIALLCPNVAEFVPAYYGILAAGGVVVPIPTLLQSHEIAHLVHDSGATLLICHGSFADIGAEVSETCGVHLISTNSGPSLSPVSTFEARNAEDPAVLFYTSGTTGKPKGAVLTHLNLVMNAMVNAFDANDLTHDSVVLGCLPLFHTFGQTVAMNSTFRVGGTLVLQPRFDPDAALELIAADNVTHFFGVPTMFIHLVGAADRAGSAPRLRSAVSGGAALPQSVLEDFEKRFRTVIYEGYGLSETSPTIAVNQLVFGTKAGTVGHPVWGVEVEIADPELADTIELLPAEAIGEIVVRGHAVFSGYHNEPEATRESMVDGWFRTGDIGFKDRSGFITIADRKKDLIIRNGFNVYPREVEDVLLRHPAIAQVAVIGIPNELVGEEIYAIVVESVEGSVDPDEILEWSRSELAGHKYPRHIKLVDQLPLGPSHKVLKRELRKQFTH